MLNNISQIEKKTFGNNGPKLGEYMQEVDECTT